MKKYLRPIVNGHRHFRLFPGFIISILAFLLLPNVILAQNFPICETLTDPDNANNTYQVCLTAVNYGAGSSTWEYTYETLTGTDISHAIFGAPCADESSEFTGATGCNVSMIDGSNIEVRESSNPDPTTGMAGIKFDCGNQNGIQTVSFTLNDQYSVGTIDLGIKAGVDGDMYVGAIPGPSCTSIAAEEIRLNLTAECAVGNLRYWRVTGDNATDGIPFTWNGPGASDGSGVVNAGERLYFTTVDDGEDNTTILSWYDPQLGSTRTKPSAHNNWPCVYHIVFEKQWSGVLAPDLKDVVILTAESSFATAECGYDANGNWYCTYTREPGNPISAPSTPDDLEVPFGESYTVTENPIVGWNAANGVGMGFQRIEGFDANALPNSLEYELATTVYSNNIPNELLKYGSHVVENESVNVDCADAVNYLQTYGLIVIEDLNTNSEVEYNTFVGGDVLKLGTSGNQLSSITPSLPSSYIGIEVAGQVQNAFNLSGYSAAFSPSNTITTVNASQVNVNGSYLFNVTSGASVSTDGTLGNKATHIKNALETASIQLSNATANNTISVSGNNVDFVVNTVDANGIAVFNIASTDLFANAQAELTNPNNLTINTVVINVSGTNINWPSSIALNGTWFNSQNGRSKTIWNFHEATSLSFDFNFKGIILAPDATFSTNQNVEGTVAVKAVTNSGQFHQPYFAGDFSSICSPSNGVVSPLCVPQGDTYALDFDMDDQGNPISAGTGIGNSGSLVQPYANLFGPGEGINIVSGDEANHPLSTYDSEGSGGKDPDLERNGTWATGNLTNEILGNLLVINETTMVSMPDDNINGGDIIFTSDVPLESFSMDLVDMQNDEIDNNDIITFTNTALNLSTIIPMADFEDIMSNTSIFKRAGVTYGDRSGNRITNITAADLGLPSFDQVTFTTDATFAIAGICIEKAPCSIAVQFSQECDGSSATLINVTGTGAPSGKFVVKAFNSNTILAMAENGETATFTGTIGTTYVVEDAVSASCHATFTTNTVTGCDDEETCPTAVFFDMSTHGFAQSGLIGTNGNFNAVIGGNFTVSSNGAVGDTEGRLAIGGNFSNNNSSTYTIGGGNPSGTGGLNAPAGEDNLVVVGDIDGPVGVRGNVVYGGTGTGISFIGGPTGIERNINDVNANVLNIPAAIADFQARSNTLDACASGTAGTVTDDGSGNFTLDGQNASGPIRFDLTGVSANSSYNFINVDNASAILINVGGATVEFSGGSISLNGNIVPTYPIDNAPSGELAFVEKTLWNFPQATPSR